MNITVVGSGYVGLVTGACFSEFGNHVTCVDNDAGKVERLTRGEMPIYEPGLPELVERNVRAGRLTFSMDLARAVDRSLVVFIAVGTPQGNDGRADLSFVREVAAEVAQHLDAYKVVVTKSTVPAGTGQMIRRIIGMSVVRLAVSSAADPSLTDLPELTRTTRFASSASKPSAASTCDGPALPVAHAEPVET